MKYSEIIKELERDVVTDGLWETDIKKFEDLRNLFYAAAVAIGAELPMRELDLATSTQAVANEVPEKAELPADIFPYREDRGVRSVVIGGTRYMVSEMNTYASVSSLASNTAFLESTDMIFNVDFASNSMYGVNLGPDVDVEYVKEFTEPGPLEADLQAADYPLSNKKAREAISLVATHLQGNRKRDGQGAQFSMILTNIYGGRSNE